MKMFLCWLFLGYSMDGKSACFTHGFCIGTDTRRGCAFMALLRFYEATIRCPRTFRWWLADQCARTAMRLRGEKVSVFAYYDSARGNRAAVLCDRLHERFLDRLIAKEIDSWDFNEAKDYIEELGSLAGAAWHRNDQPPA